MPKFNFPSKKLTDNKKITVPASTDVVQCISLYGDKNKIITSRIIEILFTYLEKVKALDEPDVYDKKIFKNQVTADQMRSDLTTLKNMANESFKTEKERNDPEKKIKFISDKKARYFSEFEHIKNYLNLLITDPTNRIQVKANNDDIATLILKFLRCFEFSINDFPILVKNIKDIKDVMGISGTITASTPNKEILNISESVKDKLYNKMMNDVYNKKPAYAYIMPFIHHLNGYYNKLRREYNEDFSIERIINKNRNIASNFFWTKNMDTATLNKASAILYYLVSTCKINIQQTVRNPTFSDNFGCVANNLLGGDCSDESDEEELKMDLYKRNYYDDI